MTFKVIIVKINKFTKHDSFFIRETVWIHYLLLQRKNMRQILKDSLVSTKAYSLSEARQHNTKTKMA